MRTQIAGDNPYDGKWLKSQRLRAGLYQHQLAAQVAPPKGINPGRVSEMETGKKPIRPEWLKEFKRIFGIK